MDCSAARLVELFLCATHSSAYFVSVVELENKSVSFNTRLCLRYNCCRSDLYCLGRRLGLASAAPSQRSHGRHHISYLASTEDKCPVS